MTKELIPTEAELVEKIARYFNKIIRDDIFHYEFNRNKVCLECADQILALNKRDQNLQQLGYMDTETYRD